MFRFYSGYYCNGRHPDLLELVYSPPPHWPRITFIGTSRNKMVPAKGEQCEQKRTNADRHN
jgi:hypothetical protein